MAAPAAPLALICSHKRTLANGHARETSAACVDGDFAVTASWDGELRVWREHSDAVARAFCETAQRVRAYPDAPSAVTAMARVADGYLVSGGVDGTCAVWTRHESREPLHPSHGGAALEGTGAASDDAGGDETPSANDPDPATPVPEPAEDPEEEGVDAETRELRIAARVKWRNEEQFRGPYARVGGFFNAADPRGLKKAASAEDASASADAGDDDHRHKTCTVRVIVPLYPRGGDAPKDDAGTPDGAPPPPPPPVDPTDEARKPRLLAVAATAHGGGLLSGVFLVDVEDAFARVQHLPHPEGVTCCLADQSCVDGHDRLVTGCLDGAIRVWRARAFFEGTELSREPTTPETPETRDEGRKSREKAKPAFELEATLRGHEGRAVTCLAWIGAHGAFPPPWRPPPPLPREFDNAVAEEEAAAAEAAAAAEPPERWPGKDSCLYFLSGGADGSVKMWERRCRARTDAEEMSATGTDLEMVASRDVSYEWAAEFSEHEVSDAPAAPRIARDVMRHLAHETLEGVGVKSLAVFGGKIVAGAGDGRVFVWGHRTRDAGDGFPRPGWILEKIHPPPNRKKSAVVRVHGFGHNMLVCCADGKAHLYA